MSISDCESPPAADSPSNDQWDVDDGELSDHDARHMQETPTPGAQYRS